MSYACMLVTLGAAFARPMIGLAQQPQATPPPDVHEHVSVTAQLLTPTRETSGTAWLPQATPMYGVHRPWHGSDLRLNGVVFLQAIYEPGDRHRTGGASTRQGSSINWGMAMARRNLGGGRVGVRTMFSAEPWTIPGCGSLNYLATGEVCDGDTIHDRQQPHDLFMELAVDYDRPLDGAWRWQVYAGLAGEPALGPPGYPHRVSAMANPIGPMTHHWLDSTHVAFGVVTVGVNNQRWKAELSAFNGRAPDEGRVALDLGALDSVAGRISFLATDRLALQVSTARLRDATTEFPVRSDPATRVTASAIYHVPLGPRGIWATTVAYGVNHAREVVAGTILNTTTSAALLETSVTVSDRHTVFSRGEVGAMPAHHLHAHEYSRSVVAIGKLQVGYVRHWGAAKGLVPGIGGTFSLSLLPPALAPRYAGRVAPGLGVFLTLRPARHAM
ncbi:MAG: hypothetical protein ABL961_12940 [Vicinamibacterales bacterium]